MVSLEICFTLSLVLVFGSVSSYSLSSFILPNTAYAADTEDMGGGDSGDGGDSRDGGDSGDGDKDNKGDDSSDIPKDAPATSGALTAGGDSDNDDDNDDDSGDNRDNDNDNNNDNDPNIEDAPATSDALTAKKCPKGQEVTLFSASCKPVGGSDSTESATSPATTCPATPTPSSYTSSEELSVTNAVWGVKAHDYEIKTELRETQETLLHRVVVPMNPDLQPKAKDLLSDPAIRAICTGKPVTVADPKDPDKGKIIYGPDGKTRTHVYSDPNPNARVTSRVIEYTQGRTTVTEVMRWDPTEKPTKYVGVRETATGIVTMTKYNPDTNNKEVKRTDDPNTGLIEVELFNPQTEEPTKFIVFDKESKTSSETTYVPGTTTPETTKVFDQNSMGAEKKLKAEIKFKPDGVTPAETINYGADGKPLPK